MSKQIGAYPREGLPVRDFLKIVKSKNPPDKGAIAKKLNKSGLYYTAKNLKGLKSQDGQHYDALVKVGAAGLHEPVDNSAQDPPWDSKSKQVTLQHNRIPGRMQMYAGHQGTEGHRLLGARTLYGADAFNSATGAKNGAQTSLQKDGHNRYLSRMESTMKKELAEKADESPNDGLAVAKEAYTYKDGEAQPVKGKGSAEWFLVDWDKLSKKGESPHQAIMQAMNAYQPPSKNTDLLANAKTRGQKQLIENKPLDIRTDFYSVAARQKGKVYKWPQPQGASTAHLREPLVSELKLNRSKRSYKLPSLAHTKKVNQKKFQLAILQRQLAQLQRDLWSARHKN